MHMQKAFGHFVKSHLAVFLQKHIFSKKDIDILKCNKFVFSCQMNQKIIAELLKDMPVLLTRHLPFWLVLPINSAIKSYLRRVKT